MTNLVQKLGDEYFTSMCRGALFSKDEAVYSVAEAGGSSVMVRNDSTGDFERLPYNFFTGWKVFEHPTLGYRKLPGGTAFLSKRQSAMRGLRLNNLRYSWSPVSSLLRARQLLSSSVSAMAKSQQIFFPEFDGPEMLDQLVDGSVASVVMSGEFMIEPITRGVNKDEYCVYHNERLIGMMDPDKKFTWKSEKHERLFHKLIKGVVNG